MTVAVAAHSLHAYLPKGHGATAQIREAYLIPVLRAMLAQFPFRIRGFHSDNSEFINHTVAKLLNKLLVEQRSW
jgi:hypothetical protein